MIRLGEESSGWWGIVAIVISSWPFLWFWARLMRVEVTNRQRQWSGCCGSD